MSGSTHLLWLNNSENNVVGSTSVATIADVMTTMLLSIEFIRNSCFQETQINYYLMNCMKIYIALTGSSRKSDV